MTLKLGTMTLPSLVRIVLVEASPICLSLALLALFSLTIPWKLMPEQELTDMECIMLFDCESS
jgi:hypothetical protein